MFQKNSIMSLKKKSKSLGHLTALGPVGSPNFGSPRMKKHISVKNFNERLKFLNHSYHQNSSNNNIEEDVVNESSAQAVGGPVAASEAAHHYTPKQVHQAPTTTSIIPRHHAPPTRSTKTRSDTMRIDAPLRLSSLTTTKASSGVVSMSKLTSVLM